MKHIISILILQVISLICASQELSWKKVCDPDTITLSINTLHPYFRRANDTATTYKVFNCTKVSDLGIRAGLAVVGYTYNQKTAAWLGNHLGPSFDVGFAYRQWNFGLRFRPWTLRPQKELVFDGDTLKNAADLNPTKLDYYLGYSFDFKRNFSLEPYLGWNRSRFYVINQEQLNKTYSIHRAGGIITGFSLNKYFRIKEFQFLSTFLSLGYSFTNFKKTHEDLDNGYFEWSFGVAYKAFYKTQFRDRIR